MPEHEGVGTHLHLLQHEPDDTLPISEYEGLGGLVELREKAFKALGQRHVRLCVGQLRLESGQLGLDRRLPLSQRRHALAQVLQREQFFLIRLDEPLHGPVDPVQCLDQALALRGHRMFRAQRRQSAIDFLMYQPGIPEQSDDLVPDQCVQRILSYGAVRTAAPLGVSVVVRSQAAIVVELPPRRPGRGSIVRVAASSADQQPLQQGRDLGVARREAAILGEPSLGQRVLGRRDQRRHRNLDPLVTRTITRRGGAGRHASPLSQPPGDPDVLARRHRGLLKASRPLIRRVAEHAPYRAALPLLLPRSRRDSAVREPARNGPNRQRLLGIAAKHFLHDRRLRLKHLVAGRLPIRLADVAIPVGSARQHVHDAAAGAMAFAPTGALTDLGFLVLGNHPLELHQEDLLGCLDSGGAHEYHLDPRAGELLEQQDLIGILAAEPIGAVHEEGVQLSLGRQVAHALQARPHERRPTPASVLVDPAVRNQIAVLGGVRAQRARLAGDRVLLFLPVRRDPSVDRGGFHGTPLLLDRHCPAAEWAARGAVVPTATADTPGSTAPHLSGQTRRRARRAYPPPPGPGRTRCSQSSSPRVTSALRLSPLVRASARSRRARLTGSFTVNTTVASGTGNPSGHCCAASTYRRAWRGETRYRRASVRRTVTGGHRPNRPSARFTRSAYWATRARRRSFMCHERTMAYVIPVNVFDTGVSDKARPGPRQSLRLRGRSHHPALGDPAFPGGLQHQPEQMQDLGILDPLGHLAEQQVLSHGVKGNGHTLPTSKASRRASRSPVDTTRSKAGPSPS